MIDVPILDGFYDCVPYLTAEKAMRDREHRVAEMVQAKGITTAVLMWNLHVERPAEVLDKCEHVGTNPLGEWYIWNGKVLIWHLTIGAPPAASAMEMLRAFGIKSVVAWGSAGAIDPEFDSSQILVVDRAIRDEGTGYHYLPPSVYIDLDKKLASRLHNFIMDKGIKAVKGTIWTTDAYFRETRGRIAKRISQGALAVDMECSALACVAKVLGLNFCQFVYFSDIVKQDDWARSGTEADRTAIRTKLLGLALEFASN